MHQPPHPPYQPRPRQPRFYDRKGFKFGCLPVLVITWVIVLISLFTGSSGDSDDKTDQAKKTTATPAVGDKLDDAGSFACDDFASGYKAAQTQSARIDLANKVNKWAQQSNTDGIASNAVALARGSEASPGAWKIGADAFAQACLDAGWDG